MNKLITLSLDELQTTRKVLELLNMVHMQSQDALGCVYLSGSVRIINAHLDHRSMEGSINEINTGSLI